MAEAAPQDAQQNFAIQRIFLKDVSFEAPNSPVIFQKEWNPDVKLDLDTQSRELGEGVYEVVLRLTVTVKNEEETAFLCEVQQGGIFTAETNGSWSTCTLPRRILPEHPIPIRS